MYFVFAAIAGLLGLVWYENRHPAAHASAEPPKKVAVPGSDLPALPAGVPTFLTQAGGPDGSFVAAYTVPARDAILAFLAQRRWVVVKDMSAPSDPSTSLYLIGPAVPGALGVDVASTLVEAQPGFDAWLSATLTQNGAILAFTPGGQLPSNTNVAITAEQAEFAADPSTLALFSNAGGAPFPLG